MATNTIDIRVPRPDVFAVLADGWSYTNWVVGASHMRAVEAGWPAAGSRIFHCAGAWPVAVRDETRVETCEPGRRLVLTASGRPFGKARIEIELDDADGHCRVTMTEYPVAGPGRLGRNPVGDAILRRRNTEALSRLAAICERHTEPQK